MSSCLTWSELLAAGTRGYDQIHQPGEPGCVPASHCRPSGHRHVLHRLVLRVSFQHTTVNGLNMKGGGGHIGHRIGIVR